MPNAAESLIKDEKRLTRLHSLRLLDSPTDPAFDRLTRLVTRILDVPVSLVTLVDGDRQFFKSQTGLLEPYGTIRETPISHSFCQHVVATKHALIIEDAREHDLVFDNLAIRDLNVIAYAGIPLVTSDGYAIGSFCAIDSQPRIWTQDDIAILRDLAASVMTEIELQEELRERQRVEASLRERRHFINRILNAAPAIIYIFDFTLGKITYLNQSLQSLIGMTVDQIDLAFLQKTLHPDDINAYDARWARLKMGDDDSVMSIEFRLKHADGGWRWIRGHHVVFARDEDGIPTQILSVARDITDMREAGQQVIDLQMERHRTNLLRQFIQHTSHDIRTPLTLIQSSVDILRRTDDPEKRHIRLQTIEDQVITIRNVLDQFNTMSELQNIDQRNLEAVNINIILADLIGSYHRHIESDFAPDLPDIWGNHLQLGEALDALLENAVIFTPDDGGISVTTRLHDDERHVVIEVSDTGIGIPETDLPHIFEPMYKVDQARTHGKGKSGLGLALAQRVVDLHEGEISVTSEINVGTTFRVVLPLNSRLSRE